MSADDVVYVVRGFMVAGMIVAAVALTWAALGRIRGVGEFSARSGTSVRPGNENVLYGENGEENV